MAPGQGLKGLGIGVHQGQQPGADVLGLGHEGLYVLLHLGVLFLTHGVVAHHGTQGRPQGAHQGGGAAAAGDRGLGGQGVQKVLTGLLSSMHKTFSFP